MRIDKDLVRRRFERSAETYSRHAVVQCAMARTLVKSLVEAVPAGACDRVLEFGCGSGTLTELLLAQLRIRHLVVNDMSERFRAHIQRLAASHPETKIDFLEGDIERCDLPAAVNVVAANAVVQWLSGVETFLARIVACLRPGGLLAFTTFGVNNFVELAAVTGHTLGYRSLPAYRELLREHVDILAAWEEQHVLRMKTPLDVLRHVRATGTNAVDASPWKRGDLAAFSARYAARYEDETGVSLTYHPMFFVCRKRIDDADHAGEETHVED